MGHVYILMAFWRIRRDSSAAVGDVDLYLYLQGCSAITLCELDCSFLAVADHFPFPGISLKSFLWYVVLGSWSSSSRHLFVCCMHAYSVSCRFSLLVRGMSFTPTLRDRILASRFGSTWHTVGRADSSFFSLSASWLQYTRVFECHMLR